MKRLALFTFCFCAAFIFVSPAGRAETNKSPTLVFREAFVRSVQKNDQIAMVYMTIVNNGNNAEKLLGASSSVAERAELHKIMDDRGVRRMHEIEEIVLPPRTAVPLKFGAYHIMLIGLKQPLVVGERVPVELHFATAGKVKLRVPVVEIKAKKRSSGKGR